MPCGLGLVEVVLLASAMSYVTFPGHFSPQLAFFLCARAAADMGSPIAILNIGPTRADDLARLKIDARSGEVSTEPFDV